MKILVDMNLSPSWTGSLLAGGFDSIHWSEVGDLRASDREPLAWARSQGHVVFTNDLDFGAILAASGAAGPSVIQVRAQDVTPGHLGPIVLATLKAFRAQIDAGALLTIDEYRSRIRLLPI